MEPAASTSAELLDEYSGLLEQVGRHTITKVNIGMETADPFQELSNSVKTLTNALYACLFIDSVLRVFNPPSVFLTLA